MIHLKKCKTCGFRVQESGKCRLFGSAKKADDFCSKHNYNPPVCSRCGAYTLKPIIENNAIYCQKCAEEIETCAGCDSSRHCEFEQNPSVTPKYIQKQVRQGPMLSQMTVKNPKRIEEFCVKCVCWNSEINDCGRQFQWCANHTGYRKEIIIEDAGTDLS